MSKTKFILFRPKALHVDFSNLKLFIGNEEIERIGEDCKEKVSCINDCSGHGECSMVKQGKAVVAKCVCEFGFGGLDCSGKVCAKDITGRECAGKGECKNGLCKCQPGFSRMNILDSRIGPRDHSQIDSFEQT